MAQIDPELGVVRRETAITLGAEPSGREASTDGATTDVESREQSWSARLECERRSDVEANRAALLV